MTLDVVRFKTFSEVYTASLREAVTQSPEKFMWAGKKEPEAVAGVMIATIDRDKGIQSVNTDGPAMRMTCQKLNIKHTRRAINSYLNGENVAAQDGDPTT